MQNRVTVYSIELGKLSPKSEHGFPRVQCGECHHEHLVAFNCKQSHLYVSFAILGLVCIGPDSTPLYTT